MLKNLLYFSSAAEMGTGLGLMLAPLLVVSLLLGAEASGVAIPLGRSFGIALLALGMACWPTGPRPRTGSAAFRAMLVYNALIAMYLAYLGVVRHLGGVLLWPAAVLHAVVALLLAWTWRNERVGK